MGGERSTWVLSAAVIAALVLLVLCAGRGIGRRRREAPSPSGGVRMSTSLIGLVAAGALTQVGVMRLEWPVGLAWIVAINVVALTWFAADKLAALLGLFRIPEATLHVLALVGGSPAILVGQDLLRHKVSADKRRFQNTLAAILVLQAAVVLWYLRLRSPNA